MFGNFFSINVCMEKYRNKNPWKMSFKKKFNQFLIIITFLFCGIIMIQNLKRRGGKKPQYYKR
jgi:hypothetical protein